MLAYLLSRLREQSTHTGVALLVAILMLAHLAGLDLASAADSALGLATALGSLAAAAKAFLPETPKPTPGYSQDGARSYRSATGNLLAEPSAERRVTTGRAQAEVRRWRSR